MPSFPQAEIKDLNELLLQLLGPGGEDIIWGNKEEEILAAITKLQDSEYLKLYKILHFYHSRYLAYKEIEKKQIQYYQFAANNELLLALTSIVDWLANPKDCHGGYTNRFVKFLTDYHSKEDLALFIKDRYVIDKGQRVSFDTMDAFAEYLYKVRSLIVHKAELGGISPYNINVDDKGTIYFMIRPEAFRRLLWQAIMKSLGLNIIKEIEKE